MVQNQALPEAAPAHQTLRHEVGLLFAVSLGAQGLSALVVFCGDLTSRVPLAQQTAALNRSLAPGRPGLDLALQLVGILTALVPVALAGHLLHRSGDSFDQLGLNAAHLRADTAAAAALAVLVGGSGLAFYLMVHAVGMNLTVVPEALPATWWRIPVLMLSAARYGLLEESLVVGYLLHRLRQLGWTDRSALGASAVLRGSYHLYQGLGGLVGNVVMGLLFGAIYQRTRRLMPLVVAHTLIDVVAFVGYALLAGHVWWLPLPAHHK